MERRKFIKTGAAVGTIGVMAGCSGQQGGPKTELDSGSSGNATNNSTGSDSSSESKVVRVGLAESQPVVLDTRTAADQGGIARRVVGTLAAFGRQGELKPHLATDWTYENDGKELVLKLRKGVSFHDGSKFNAEYVKWHLMNFLANGEGTSYIVESVTNVVVEDSHRVRVKFKEPDPYIVWDLASAWGQLHSREAVEKYGNDYGKSGKVVSTGPFKEVEHGQDGGVLKKFEEWDWPEPWQKDLYEGGTDIRPDKIIYKAYPEAATRTSAFEAGDIDAIQGGVPYAKLPKYEQNEKLRTGTPPVTTEQMFAMLNLDPESSTAPVLAESLSLRKGISYAINRSEIIDVVFNGAAAPATNYLVPAVSAHDLAKKHNYTFDVEKAKQVMRDDGWTINPGGVSIKDSREAEFTLLVQNDSISRKRSTLWKEHLQKIGVRVSVTTVDIATFKEKIGNNNFAAGLSSFYDWGNADQLWWMASESADDSYYFNSNAWVQYPEVTKMLDKAGTSQTLEQRTQQYKKAHRYLLENVVPAIYSVYPQRPQAWREEIKNWKPHYKGTPVWPVYSGQW